MKISIELVRKNLHITEDTGLVNQMTSSATKKNEDLKLQEALKGEDFRKNYRVFYYISTQAMRYHRILFTIYKKWYIVLDIKN